MTDKCKCSMSTQLVGDGCSICNPEYAKRFVRSEIEDDADILVGYVAAALQNKEWEQARSKIIEYLTKYENKV